MKKTLHQAIESILEESGRPLTTNQIATAINQKQMYRRGDDQPVRSSQIRARVEQYPGLFKKVDNKIGLNKYSDRPDRILQTVLDMLSHELNAHAQGLLILYILFYVKISSSKAQQLFGEWLYDPSRINHQKDFVINSWTALKKNGYPIVGATDITAFIKKLDGETFKEVINQLDNVKEKEVKSFLNLLVLKQIGGEWQTPLLLAKYIASLVHAKPNDLIYDPFAGAATLINEIITKNPDGRYHLRDINTEQVFWGTLVTILVNPSAEFHYDYGDSSDVVANYQSLFSPDTTIKELHYDWVISQPPLGVKYPNLERQTYIFLQPEESIHNMIVKGCQSSIKVLERDIKKTEKMIADLIKEDAQLHKQYHLATSVTGIGKITALNMIVSTGEFSRIRESKKFACYSGVAPFEYRSGTSIRGKSRVSKTANVNIKKLLHLSAMAAIQYDEEIKLYYHRKVEAGKNKMSVINAVRNKLISRVFACINKNRPYQKNYKYVLA